MFLFKVNGCANYTILREPGHACDSKDLVTGWYRLQGAVVGDWTTDKNDLKGECGVDYQGWDNGSHPTVTEGAVTRKVCFSFNKSCCLWGNLIKVKNCSSYYVYELHKNSANFLRHCGNASAGK